MSDTHKKNFSVNIAFKEGLKGFTNFWIPLCAISAAILAGETWLPRLAIKISDASKAIAPYTKALKQFEADISNAGTAGMAFYNLRYNLNELISSFTSSDLRTTLLSIAAAFGAAFIILSFLYIATIITSMASVSRRKEKINIKKETVRAPLLSFSYLILSIIKVLPFCISILLPLMFFIYSIRRATGAESGETVIFTWLLVLALSFFIFVSGLFLYIKLYFTGFIITEKSANPFKAVALSFSMTKGLFFKIFVLFIITSLIDILGVISIIGFIPANSLKYTLRASAYNQISQNFEKLPQ